MSISKKREKVETFGKTFRRQSSKNLGTFRGILFMYGKIICMCETCISYMLIL